MKSVKFVLYVLLNIPIGFLILGLIIFAGFSGNIIITTVVLFISFLICFFASKEAAEKYPNFFWIFGICYIIFPLGLAIAGSESTPAGTIRLKLIWFGILLLLYIISYIGGLKGKVSGIRKRQSSQSKS